MWGRKGFSLVEMMVAFAIVAAISGFLVSTLVMGQRSWQVGEAHMAVSFELRRGIDAMAREIASSQPAQLSIPANGTWQNAITFHVPQDQNGDGTVLDAGGVLEWSPHVTYSLGGLNGSQIQRTQSGAVQVLANGVTQLQFRRQAATPNVVEMSFTVQRGATEGFTNQGTVNTRIRLRN